MDDLDYIDLDDMDYFEVDDDDGDAEFEALDLLFTGEGDEEGDEDRRRRRRRRKRRSRRRGVKTARGRSLFSRPASKRYVTQAQLKAGLDRVGKEIRTNAAAIKTVNGRVASVSRRVSNNTTVNEEQSRAIAKNRKCLNETREMMLLTTLLSGGARTLQTTAAVVDAGGRQILPANTQLSLAETSNRSRLLPLLLMGQSCGDSGSGLGGNPLALVLLAGGLN